MTALSYILIFGLLSGLAASLVWGLWWALRGGQFSDFQKGATCIFDPEEPPGCRTDAFPDECARAMKTPLGILTANAQKAPVTED